MDPNQKSVYPSLQQQQGTAPPMYDYNQQPMITQQPMMTTVIMQQAAFGPDPQRLSCPQCRANIVSNVTSEPSTKTHIIALVICLLGGFCGCCFIPYCVDSCQAQKHACPNCGSYLGMHN